MSKLFRKLMKTNNENTREYYEDMPVYFKRDGSLMRNKLLEFLPAMIVTNLSNLLLVTVDGIVVGNFLGNNAFATVNVFGPIIIVIGAITAIASTGISTCLSTALGTNRQEEINRVRTASFQFMWIMVVLLSVIQIPIVKFIIDSYHLNSEMNSLVWQYAIGIMICTPCGVISTIGVYQLQVVGKMKMLMKFAIMEGVINLLFDLLFVGGLKLGVAGAGYGTACANVIRATATFIYLSRHTDIYKKDDYKTSFNDLKEIFLTGVPGCSHIAMNALQAYFMMIILLDVAGTDGCIIAGVAAFCSGLIDVLKNGLQGSMRPLVGLLSGQEDRVGLSKLMESSFRLCIIGGSFCIIITMLFPHFFYNINGIKDIPYGGIIALRFFSLSFIAEILNGIIGLFLTNRKDYMFVSRLNLIGSAILPVVAFIISKVAPSYYLWLSYVINETIVFAILYIRFLWWKHRDRQEDYKSNENMVLYMTVSPDKAITASRAIRKFANDYGINPWISNRVALCMEEMVAYADKTKDDKKWLQYINKVVNKTDMDSNIFVNEFSVQIMVRFKGNDAAKFTVLDDGHKIKLDIDEKERSLTTDNYELIRRLSKSFDYQYILDMNYVTIKFEKSK